MRSLSALLPLLLLPSVTQAGSIVPIERVAVEVAFSTANWRLEIDGRGRLDRVAGDSKLPAQVIDDAHLKRIRGLALCIATVPEPEIPGPPLLQPPKAMPPVVLLDVRAKTVRGRVVERRVELSPGILGKDEMSADVGPSLLLLFDLRALMGPSGAYDYRPWLRDLLPRTSHLLCPWLDEPVRE